MAVVGIGCTALSPTPQIPPLPKEGTAVERRVEGGKAVTWRLAPEKSQYLELRLDPPGAVTRATLSGAAGVVAEATGEVESRYPLRLLAIVPADEPVTLEVAAPASGTLQLKVDVRRPARSSDVEQVAALNAFYTAQRSLRQDLTASDYRRILSTLQDAAKGLGDIGHPTFPYALLQEANSYLYLYDYAAASEAAQRAQLVLEGIDEPSARELGWLAEAYSILARVSKSNGRTETAIELLTKAIDIYGRWSGSSSLFSKALFLNSRALAYLDLERFEQGEADFLTALGIARDTARRRLEASVLLNLATLQLKAGSTPEAFERFEEARPQVARLGIGSQLHLASTLGSFYITTGQLDQARDLLEEGLALAREKEDAAYEIAILDHLGRLYRIMGSPGPSVEAHAQAFRLASLQEDSFRRVTTGLHLGRALADQGRWEEAGQRFRESLELAETGDSPTTTSLACSELGLLLSRQGNHGEARDWASRAVSAAADAPTSRNLALVALGEIELAANRPDVARAALQEALALTSVEADPLSHAQIRAFLGLAFQQEGDLDSAKAHLEGALTVYEEIRGHISAAESRAEFLTRWHNYYGALVEVLMELDRRDPGAGWVERALEVSERSRSRTLVEILAEGRIRVRRKVPDRLSQLELRLGDHLALLRNDVAQTRAAGDVLREGALQDSLDSTRTAFRAVEEEIRRDHTSYANLRYPEPLTYEEMSDLLPHRTRLLHYTVHESASYLFVVGGGEVTGHRLPQAAVLRERVAKLRAALEKHDISSRRSFRESSQSLWEDLLAPALEPASGPSEPSEPPQRLWVVWGSPLHTLPMELLLDREGRYAIEQVEIGYTPSMTVLANLQSSPAIDHAVDFVGFANPEGFASGKDELPAIPGVELEVRSIAELFPDSARLFIGATANQDNLTTEPAVAEAQWLHFASHGIVRDDEPERSALVLSPDSRGDRLLEISEVFELELKAEAVVLSACQTGLGKEVKGEGIVGFTRAFLYAGSQNVVVSLWPVSDHSTAVFMRHFYELLRTSDEPAAALFQTKKALIQEGWPVRAWAPFIVIGGLRQANERRSLNRVSES